MSNSVKDMNIKNRTHYLFNDIIYNEDLDQNNVKIDENSYENILIYYIGYVAIKKGLKTHSVNPLYLIFGKVRENFEETNENKCLTLVPTNENKEKIKTYEELWTKIKDLLRSITKSIHDYNTKYIKIKFDSDDGPKPLCIRFNKIDGFIISLDCKIKHLVFLIMDSLIKFVIRLNIL